MKKQISDTEYIELKGTTVWHYRRTGYGGYKKTVLHQRDTIEEALEAFDSYSSIYEQEFYEDSVRRQKV